MKSKMTVMGVAPLIALHYVLFPLFAFTSTPSLAMRIGGAVLIAFGLVMLVYSGPGVLYAFRTQRLLTKGFFAVFPNPMYAAYILAIVPGLALVLDSWLVLTGSAVLYALFRALVPAEDRWLREKFGAQYDEYRQRVLVKVF